MNLDNNGWPAKLKEQFLIVIEEHYLSTYEGLVHFLAPGSQTLRSNVLNDLKVPPPFCKAFLEMAEIERAKLSFQGFLRNNWSNDETLVTKITGYIFINRPSLFRESLEIKNIFSHSKGSVEFVRFFMKSFNFSEASITLLSPIFFDDFLPLLNCDSSSNSDCNFFFGQKQEQVSLPNGILEFTQIIGKIAQTIFGIKGFVNVFALGNSRYRVQLLKGQIPNRRSSRESTLFSLSIHIDNIPLQITCRGDEYLHTVLNNNYEFDFNDFTEESGVFLNSKVSNIPSSGCRLLSNAFAALMHEKDGPIVELLRPCLHNIDPYIVFNCLFDRCIVLRKELDCEIFGLLNSECDTDEISNVPDLFSMADSLTIQDDPLTLMDGLYLKVDVIKSVEHLYSMCVRIIRAWRTRVAYFLKKATLALKIESLDKFISEMLDPNLPTIERPATISPLNDRGKELFPFCSLFQFVNSQGNNNRMSGVKYSENFFRCLIYQVFSDSLFLRSLSFLTLREGTDTETLCARKVLKFVDFSVHEKNSKQVFLMQEEKASLKPSNNLITGPWSDYSNRNADFAKLMRMTACNLESRDISDLPFIVNTQWQGTAYRVYLSVKLFSTFTLTMDIFSSEFKDSELNDNSEIIRISHQIYCLNFALLLMMEEHLKKYPCKPLEQRLSGLSVSSATSNSLSSSSHHLFETPMKTSSKTSGSKKSGDLKSPLITGPAGFFPAIDPCFQEVYDNLRFSEYRQIKEHVYTMHLTLLNRAVVIKIVEFRNNDPYDSCCSMLDAVFLQQQISHLRNATKLIFALPESKIPIRYYNPPDEDQKDIIGLIYPLYHTLPSIKSTCDIIEIFYGISYFLQDLHQKLKMVHLDIHSGNVMMLNCVDSGSISRKDIVVIDLETVTKIYSRIENFNGCRDFSEDLFKAEWTCALPAFDIICLSRLIMEWSCGGKFWCELARENNIQVQWQHYDSRFVEFLNFLLSFARTSVPRDIKLSIEDIINYADCLFQIEE